MASGPTLIGPESVIGPWSRYHPAPNLRLSGTEPGRRATVSAYLAHGVRGDERRFRGDRDRDGVVGGLGPDLRVRARTSAGFAW